MDYELIDSGNGQKLEKFGPYTFIRPEPQAIWRPNNSNWQADAIFVGEEEGPLRPRSEASHWQFNKKIPERWKMSYGNIRFWAKVTPFRHLGFFPESISLLRGNPQNVLNLFGYTGLATLFFAKNGAKVTHVDASKKSVAWAKENQELSSLQDKPIRWIVDDANKFVEREIKRGQKYDAIILDPPKFGRGPDGEVWKIEEELYPLLVNCKKLLSDVPLFVSLTTYAIRLSPTSLKNIFLDIFGGNITSGELSVKEKNRDLVLPQAIFSQWTK